MLDLDGDGWVDRVAAEPLDGVRWGLLRRGVNALPEGGATAEGPGTLLAPEPAADGVTLRVQAPGVVGSARLTVRTDGVPLRTRPRLGFTPP